MIEVLRRFLRQKYGSVGITVTLAVLALLTAIQAVFQGPGALGGGVLALVILAAGSISTDASSGALQMILARPVSRTEYLLGRYFGIVASYGVYLAAAIGATLALAPLVAHLFGTGTAPPQDLRGLLLAGVGEVLSALLFGATLLFFSTFLRGYFDVAGYVLLSILLSAPSMLAEPLKAPWLASVGRAAKENVLPRVPWDEVLRGDNVLRASVGQFALAVVGFLLLAAVVFARREFSYGRD
jgi:hypothetical protein